MLVYAIRHAESQANVSRAAGLNSTLSPLGLQQAQAIMQRLGGLKLSAIYASPYQRCIDTAWPLATQLGLSIRLRPELCEFHNREPDSVVEPIDLPSAGHKTWELKGVSACPDYEGPMLWPGLEESRESLLDRMKQLAIYLKARWLSADDAVVLFSHGSPIARLIEAWITDSPGPSFRFVIDNAAISALRYHDGVSSLICLNEASHLRHLPAAAAANYTDNGSIKPLPPSGYW